MTEQAKRYNEGKPQMGLIYHYPKAIEFLVRVLEHGECKYDHLNWKKGNKPDQEYLDSMNRHIFKYFDEGPIDPDSGCHHAGHALWNLMTWIELNITQGAINPELFEKICKELKDATS